MAERSQVPVLLLVLPEPLQLLTEQVLATTESMAAVRHARLAVCWLQDCL